MDAETRVEAPFGDWLMRKLRERDMSLSDVARLAQCDYTYLWRLVNVGRARGRQYRRPSYDMAERVGRALGSTHEALTAAGYLPADNVQNSRVVDALDRVERQLLDLREELTRAAEGSSDSAGGPMSGNSGRPHAGERTDGTGTAVTGHFLPLVEGERWPADPDAVPDRIELPEWLAADADWAVRVPPGGANAELRPGDVALIRGGAVRPGRLVAVLRRGKLDFTTTPGDGVAVGTVTGLFRRLVE
jgi:hypothetical protein